MKLGMIGSGMIVSMALSALKETDEIQCTAILSRDPEQEKVRRLRQAFAIERSYADRQAFLRDDSFDTVYVGVVNSLHYEYVRAALFAGKNVICEKPFTVNGKQAKELMTIAEQKKLFLFEAVTFRYSPNYESIKKHLAEVGTIKMIQCNYSQYSSRYDQYRRGWILPAFDRQYGGGSLYDINVYNIHFVTGLFGKPDMAQYFANTGPNGIDTSGVVFLDYGGFKAVCTGAKDSNSPAWYLIQGEEGFIRVEGRLGFDEKVYLVKNEQEPVCIGVKSEQHFMAEEFLAIKTIIDTKDHDLTNHYLKITCDVMEIMEAVRLEAGIFFE